MAGPTPAQVERLRLELFRRHKRSDVEARTHDSPRVRARCVTRAATLVEVIALLQRTARDEGYLSPEPLT